MARCSLVRALCSVVLLLVACAARAGGASLAVPLSLAEPSGVARAREPVTVGVPLPAGRVHDAATLWIADAAGHEVPSQTRAFEHWPDGSVRWVLVDFLATASPYETARYVLRDGHPRAAPDGPRVRLEDAGSDRRLDSGAATFVVAAAGPALVREVRVGAADAGVTVATPAPTVEGAAAGGERDRTITVETAGPVRTELLVTGRFASDLAYEARLAAFAGAPWLRLQLTLTSLSRKPYSRVQGAPVTVATDAGSAAIGLEGGVRRFDSLAHAHRVEQPDAGPARVDGEPAGRPGAGWAQVRGPRAAVTVVRRFFAEEWPQAIVAGERDLSVDLLAGGDEPVELGIGAAKTFELWIAVEDAAHASDPATLATRLQHPLVAWVDPAWTVASRALPNAIGSATPGAHEVLPRIQTGIGRYLARNRAERWDDGPPVPCEQRKSERERIGAFGALNWGDWNFPGYRDRSKGCDAWGNLEYDLAQVLGLTWTATGTRVDWDAFVAAARHYRDVDVIHFAPGSEEIVGFNHPHKVKHFAIEAKQTIDLGHTWLEGLVTHYRLTGEVRSLEAARGIADVIVRRQSKAGNPRQYGWPMIALVAAWDATRDPRYRASAQAYADAAVAMHEATPAAGDWKMGILADGMAGVHAATGDEQLHQWLVEYSRVLLRERKRFADPRYALAAGYLSAIDKDPALRALALETVDTMPIGDWGKTLAVSGRTAFRILAPLDASARAATPARAAPRPASEGGPRRPSPSRAKPGRPAAR